MFKRFKIVILRVIIPIGIEPSKIVRMDKRSNVSKCMYVGYVSNSSDSDDSSSSQRFPRLSESHEKNIT